MTTVHWWLVLVSVATLLLVLDYLTGPLIRFPVTFVLPVALAAWFLGRWPALGFGIVLSLLRFVVVLSWGHRTDSLSVEVVNAIIHLAVLVGVAVLLTRLADQSRRVEVLEGLLPICSFCKKIRRDDGAWEPIEAYISDRTPARFTHGFCEECARTHYPELFPSRGRG